MSSPIIYRTLREKDEEAVKGLVESTFLFLPMGRFWDWKYLRNPGFDRSLVAVAEEGGKIVGCNHWLPRKVKITDSIVVDSMLGANIAVAPEYRKKGVGRELIYFLRSQHIAKKPSLMYMFTDSELRKHFHAPVAGYVPAPGGTVWYRKILNWNKVKTSVADFNERVKRREFGDRLAQVDLTIAIKPLNTPTLCLHLSKEGAEIIPSAENADVKISSYGAVFSKVKNGHNGTWILIRALLTGRLKLKGSLRKIWAVYRNMWAFREILSGRVT